MAKKNICLSDKLNNYQAKKKKTETKTIFFYESTLNHLVML